MKKKSKLIVILGATATGKTNLAIKMAKEFNGEIVSADSRQVYRHMKIGTDVPKGIWKGKHYFVQGVPHYMIDCLDPDQDFSLSNYIQEANKIIGDIISRGKTPFLVGGTGMYISAIVENWDIPKVKPNFDLRKRLQNKTLDELTAELRAKDPASAEVIDMQNPRRIIRALEVLLNSGNSFVQQRKKSPAIYDVLQIGIQRDRQEIYDRINNRVDEMVAEGLVDEVRELIDTGYNWDLSSMSGLGYRQFHGYLDGEQTLEEAVEILKRDTRKYAKRQISWFKRDDSINWVDSGKVEKVAHLINDFIST